MSEPLRHQNVVDAEIVKCAHQQHILLFVQQGVQQQFMGHGMVEAEHEDAVLAIAWQLCSLAGSLCAGHDCFATASASFYSDSALAFVERGEDIQDVGGRVVHFLHVVIQAHAEKHAWCQRIGDFLHPVLRHAPGLVENKQVFYVTLQMLQLRCPAHVQRIEWQVVVLVGSGYALGQNGHVAVFGPAVMILRQTAAACQTAHDFLQGYVCLLQRALGVGFPRAVVIFATLPAAIEQTHLRPVFHFYDY